MGAEKIETDDGIKGDYFWSGDDDEFRKYPDLKCNALVLGGGDGALQDVLRLVTRYDHPLSMIEALEQDPSAGAIIKSKKQILLSVESHAMLSSIHGQDKYLEMLDKSVEKVAKDLARNIEVIDSVMGCMRECEAGKTFYVFHVMRDKFFTKSYLLNRFLIYLIINCTKYNKVKGNFVSYRLYRNSTVNKSPASPEYIVSNASTRGVVAKLINVKLFSVRYGPKSGVPTILTAAGYHKTTTEDFLGSLSKIPLPKVLN